MIWRVLVRRSVNASVAVQRLCMGVLLLSALGTGNKTIAQGTPVSTTATQLAEQSMVLTPATARPTVEIRVNPAVAIAKGMPVAPALMAHQPVFSATIAGQATRQLAQNPNSNTDPLPNVDPLPTAQPLQNPTPATLTTPNNGDRPITVNQVKVTGSSLYGEAEFAPLLAPIQGKTIPLSQVQQTADQITQLYLQNGYITSRAIVVAESLNTGNIELRVIEGQVDQINIQGTRRISDNYLGDRLRLATQKPLNTNTLEDQLRLLKLNPIIDNIEATLKAGEGLGQSDLDISVTEADSFSFNIGVDNYSPASVGSERMTLDFIQENLTGSSDRLGLGYIRTTRGGAESLDLNYTRPINAKDGSITLRTVLSRNEVIQEPFDVLDISGESERYELSFRQPLIRNPREEFALGLGFTYQDGLTFLGNEPFGFNIGTEDGRSTTSVLKFTQEYLKRRPTSALSLRSQFSIGTGLFDATSNDDPIPDGRFWGWLGQAQHVRLLNPNNLLVFQADLQLTPNSLLPSQQFVIGGGQSIRGFRQNARSADNGFRFSVEDRLTLVRNEAGDAIFQVMPFLELGSVWNNGDNPNTLPNQTFLAGAGIGTWWQMEEGLTVRLDYGIPFVDLDDRGDNLQDHGLYFNVNYLF